MDDFIELELRDVRAVYAVKNRLPEPHAIASAVQAVDQKESGTQSGAAKIDDMFIAGEPVWRQVVQMIPHLLTKLDP